MRRLLSVLLGVILTISLTAPAGASISLQTDSPEGRALRLLERMTPEERVGQLFLVTFSGPAATPESQIYDLIVNRHVGGVMLNMANDNILPQPNTVAGLYDLIASLQQFEWESSQSEYKDPFTGLQRTRTYVPLLVGVQQAGGGYPDDQIFSGLSPLPSPMAIGATWNPALAEQVAVVMGKELSSLGINLYLGPSLDVLETPNPAGEGDPGSSVFGGDPFWVGEMGRAYISGLHLGSADRLLVVPKHFPGLGASDRSPDEEVATVRKSLEQLKQVELAPFFAVTGAVPDPSMRADGLLISHIRYQGLQGNIRATTRPVSFDQVAQSQIMALEPLAEWRADGGLIISDDLSSLAVRRFYDPGGQSFSARLVARDALVAGNDLLNMGNIFSSDAPDTYTTILRVLEFFTQKYREDTAFAERVDDAALRVLTQKFTLYGSFSLGFVQPDRSNLETIGQSQIGFEVARQSVTLVSPNAADLDTLLAGPPERLERIVFITDVRKGRQCSTCPEEAVMGVDSLQSAILRLYGPEAGAQALSSLMSYYSFADLETFMLGEETPLTSSLTRANWVVISITDTPQSQAQYRILRQFITERQNLLRTKRVVLFAFGAPYYLDATDISKITAYYGLYSKTPAFVEMAARLLYQEITPTGSLPVSVPGIGYELITATSPDPAQVISLSLDPAPVGTGTLTAQASPQSAYNVGDTITVKTGIILDHNGHPVPDGTVVRFTLTTGSDQNLLLQQFDANTTAGVARMSFRIDKPGKLELRAASEPAVTSVVLQWDVTDSGAQVTVIPPTPLPTNTILPTATPPPQDQMAA
jgi:beta-N-acetylhexosaminidase